MRVDITTPAKWSRSIAWRMGRSNWIIAAAFAPTAFFVGAEFLTGFGKGLGISLGPVWLGIARAPAVKQGDAQT